VLDIILRKIIKKPILGAIHGHFPECIIFTFGIPAYKSQGKCSRNVGLQKTAGWETGCPGRNPDFPNQGKQTLRLKPAINYRLQKEPAGKTIF
jgi:hypothetical protein